jgi:beta-glucosidase
VTATVEVTNTGETVGDEVVQCYVRDETASVTPFLKRLRGFRRVRLKPGESRQVRFALGPDELSVWNRHMEKVVEPGWFVLQIGGSSAHGQTAHFAVLEPGRSELPTQRADAIVLSREQDMEA